MTFWAADPTLLLSLFFFIPLLLFFFSLPASFHCVSQEFSTGGSSNTDTGKAAGNLETKYKVQDLGLTLNQKWNTDNVLTTEVTLEDQVSPGRQS